MKITVIGHLCLDAIHHADGAETQSPGGIFFSVATLANLLPATDVVQPVFGIGKNEHDAIIEQLQHYPNVDTSGIYRFNGPTNQVALMYKDSQERIECSRHIAEPIPFKKIKPYLETDLLLINMISGFDVTLETLDQIRMEVREEHTPIYMDVHSLTLGLNDDFTRYHRPVDAWRRWLFMIHAAQMNEEEAACLTSESFSDEQLTKHISALNTKVSVITRGERGCTAFVDTHKHLQRYDIPGIPAHDRVDPTGCGDVFAAAYCAHYMKTRDVVASLTFANRVAGSKAQFAGSTAIDTLASFRLEEAHQEQQS